MRFLIGTPILILIGFSTLVTCLVLLFFFFIPCFPKAWQDQIISFWGRICLFLSCGKVFIYGKENLPRGGALFLFNHLSLLDIPSLNIAVPKLRFGAKAELFQIPIFGFTLRKIGTLVVTRSDSKKTIQLYKESVKRVKKGECFALAPEGRRQDGRKISSFKRGPFVFALEGKLPLVPIVLVGTDKILPRKSLGVQVGFFRRKRIEIHILPPIETKNLSMEDLQTLRMDVQRRMSDIYSHRLSKKKTVLKRS